MGPWRREKERGRKCNWRSSGWKYFWLGQGNTRPDPEGLKIPKKMNPKRSASRYIIIKMLNVEDKKRT